MNVYISFKTFDSSTGTPPTLCNGPWVYQVILRMETAKEKENEENVAQ